MPEILPKTEITDTQQSCPYDGTLEQAGAHLSNWIMWFVTLKLTSMKYAALSIRPVPAAVAIGEDEIGVHEGARLMDIPD